MKSTKNASKPETLNTYLVSYGLGTVGIWEHRDNYWRGLVEAQSLVAAEKIAMESHCPEAFEEEEDEDNDENSDMSVEGHGTWLEWNGHEAFKFGDNHSEVDRGCVFWIESVVEVPEADAVVLREHLGIDASETDGEESLPPSVPPPSIVKSPTLTMRD